MRVTDLEHLTDEIKKQSASTAQHICEDALDYMDSRGVYFETTQDRIAFRSGMREKLEGFTLEIAKLIVAYQEKQKKGKK